MCFLPLLVDMASFSIQLAEEYRLGEDGCKEVQVPRCSQNAHDAHIEAGKEATSGNLQSQSIRLTWVFLLCI